MDPKVFEDLLRGITAALPEMVRPPSFLGEYLFKTPEYFGSGDVDVARYRANRRIATSTPRGAPANVTEKTSYTGTVITPPSFKPKMIITSNDLKKRLPGEGMTTNDTGRTQALAQIGAEIAEDLDGQITRAGYLQATDGLFDAGIRVFSETGDVLATIPTGRTTALNNANVSLAWTNSSSTPLPDINTAADLIQKTSGWSADFVLGGTAAINALMSHATVKSDLSKDWSGRGQLMNQLQASGARWHGTVDGRDIFSLNDYYKHPKTGALTAFIPTGKILVGSSQVGVSPLYALPDDVENPVASDRLMKMWKSDDPSGYFYQMLAAMLVFPKNVDAFCVRNVIGF